MYLNYTTQIVGCDGQEEPTQQNNFFIQVQIRQTIILIF